MEEEANITPFPCLPLELVAYIFETTARIHPRSRTTLNMMLVSRQVYKWIEPVMYETVILDLSSTVHLRMIILPSNPDFVSRLSRFTKHLYISSSVSFEDNNEILSQFSNLASLSCSIGCAERFSCLIEEQRLQHASLTIPEGIDLNLASASPLSSSLTHLEICSTLRHMPKLDRLPHLTHLAVPYDWLRAGCIRTTLENCRALRVLVLRGFENEATPLILFGIDDCRVVIIDYTIDPINWEESWSSDKGIWGHAEAVILMREKGAGRYWTNAERVHLKRWRKPDPESVVIDHCSSACPVVHRQLHYRRKGSL